MFEINVTRIVKSSIEDSFLYLCNLENDPEWWTGVVEVKCLSDTPYGVGVKYWQKNRLMGLHFLMTIEITEFQMNEKMSFKSISQTLAPFVATYLFKPTEKGTELTMLGFSKADGLFFKLLGPIFKFYLRILAEKNFDNLQQILDAKIKAYAG